MGPWRPGLLLTLLVGLASGLCPGGLNKHRCCFGSRSFPRKWGQLLSALLSRFHKLSPLTTASSSLGSSLPAFGARLVNRENSGPSLLGGSHQEPELPVAGTNQVPSKPQEVFG